MTTRTVVDQDGKWEVREHDRGEERILVQPSEDYTSRQQAAAAEEEAAADARAQEIVDYIHSMSRWSFEDVLDHLIDQEEARLNYDAAVRRLTPEPAPREER